MAPMGRIRQKQGQLDVRVLGSPELFFRGRSLAGSLFDKPTALFLYLAVERRRHKRSDLIGLLWPEMDERSGRQNLNSTIYILKKRFQGLGVMDCDRFCVWWELSGWDPDPVDLARLMENKPFRECDTLHEPSSCNRCHERITSCLSEYRGDFLESTTLPHLPAYETWIREVREGVRSRVLYLKGLLSGTTPVVTPDAPSVEGPESRQATILCLQVEPENREDLQDLLLQIGKCRELFSDLSVKNGGWVAPFHGSAWFSYFGFPSSQENSARQAVRTALGILEKVRTSDSPFPPVRMGIHTGEIVCDLARGLPDVLGEATRMATLVADEAGPGETLATEGTIGSIRSFFISESEGERLFVNGKNPVTLHRILGESEGPSFGELFVGREKELGILLKLWRQVLRGEKKVVWVTGEAGIGKSRLVHALVRSLGQSAVVRELYCFPECQMIPWFPLTRFFRTFLSLNPKKTADEIRYAAEKYLLSMGRPVEEDLPAFLRFVLGEGHWSDRLPPLSPGKVSVLIENLMVDLLSVRVRNSPVLLIVEDCPWADQLTIAMIRKLLGTISSGRLMVLMVSRTGSALRNLSFDDPDCQIELLPLDPEESRKFIGAISSDALPPEKVRELVSLGSGVPLFLEEYVRMAIRSSSVQTSDFSPNTMELLSSRIDDLGEHKELAQIAACLGREFPKDLFGRVASSLHPGQQVPRWECGLNTLFGKGILIRSGEDPESVLSFRHGILRDAILRSLPDSRRMLIHRRTVDVLREQFSDRVEQEPDCLAEHMEKAGMFEEVLPVLVRAAKRAIAMGAIQEAGARLEKALEIVRSDRSEKSRERELEILLVIGPVSRVLHGYGSDRIDAIYRSAFELCDMVGPSFRTFPLLYAMWASAITRFGPAEALPWARNLMIHSRKSGLWEDRVRASHVLGNTFSWTGNLDESERSLKDGLSEAAGFYDLASKPDLSPYAEEPVVGLMCDLSRVYCLQGRSGEAESWASRAIGRSTDLGHPLSLCLSLSSMTLIHFFSGESEKADAVSRRLRSLSETHGFELWVHSALFSIGWSKGSEKGCDMMRDAKQVIMKDLPGYAPLYSLFEADGAIRAKNPERALIALQEGRRAAVSTGISILDPELLRLEGEARLMIEPHRSELSRALYGEALDRAISSGAYGLALKAVLSLSRIVPGDILKVREILEHLPEIGRAPDWEQAFRISQNVQEPSGESGLP